MPSVAKTGDTATDRALGVLEAWLRSLERWLLFMNSTVIVDVAIATAGTVIPHTLNRVPVRWIVLDKNANAVIWRSAASTSNTITLKSSAAVTATIAVR